MRFNERWVERLKSTGKRETFWDDQPYGDGSFGLRVNPSGSKTWVFKRYDKDTKKQLWVTLGTYPQISLDEARNLARRQENPAGDGTSEEANGSPIPTVRELGTLYIEKWAKVRKRSWREDLRILEHDVYPLCASQTIDTVQKRDILRILDTILDRGSPIMANRTYAFLHKLFAFAKSRGLISINPVSDVEKPAKERKKDRLLSASEISTLLDAILSPTRPIAGVAMRHLILFQLATACRPGEARLLEWSEIQDGVWTLPKEKAKNGHANIIPLTGLTQAILAEQQKLPTSESPYVFTSAKTGTCFYETSENHILQRVVRDRGMTDFSAHDLRRTAASHLAALGTSRVVIKRILNHVDNDITAIYDRHTYDAEKRAALTAWNDQLRGWIRETDPHSSLLR